jgi:phosphatidylethanolamine-binding protein (PEBP) family uncharacterized protein
MNKTIRLIHRGQLLREDTFTLFDYDITQQSFIFIHCALANIMTATMLSQYQQRRHQQQRHHTNKVKNYLILH